MTGVSSSSQTRRGADEHAVFGAWSGIGLLLIAALMFSLHNTLARLAYDHGVTSATVAAARTWMVLAMFVAILGARRGEWPRVPRLAWLAFAVTAVCYSLHNPLLLVSFEFIPVSLAVLVLYVYPILVAFLAAAFGQDRIGALHLIAATAAFAGVALVLQADRAPDWRGIAAAGLASLALSANIVGAAALNRHMSALAVPFALSCVGAVVFSALALAEGGPALPASATGWLIFAAATLTSPIALIAFYAALPRTGAPRSALVMNVEPVLTVLLATAILGERLGGFQAAGAALVIGAITIPPASALWRRRKECGRVPP